MDSTTKLRLPPHITFTQSFESENAFFVWLGDNPCVAFLRYLKRDSTYGARRVELARFATIEQCAQAYRILKLRHTPKLSRIPNYPQATLRRQRKAKRNRYTHLKTP